MNFSNPNTKSLLADNLKKVRTANNLSQEQFAKIIGINRVVLAYYETKERECNLSLEQISTVSNFFRVPIETLIGDPEMVYIPVFGLNETDAKGVEKFTRIIKNYQRMCRLERKLDLEIENKHIDYETGV